ncbi:MAG: hypothetical protein ACE5GF_07105, partial [Thermodesulfobacteriota bacterium]
VLSDAYWAANGNAAFATNVANWVADSGPATVTSYCIANKPVAQNTLTCVQAQQTIPQNSTITAVVPDSNVDFSYTGAIYYTALDGTDGVLDMGPLNVANYTPWPMFVMVDENLATFTGDIGVGARYKSNSETVFQGLEGKTVSELIATKLECHLTAGFFNGNQWHDDIWSTQWDVQAKLAEPNNAQAEPAQFEGAIQSIAIDAANNTVDVTVGNVVVTVDGQTTVTLNGQPAVLDDLQVGYNAAGLYDATNNHAIEIVLEGEGGGGQGGGDQGGNQGGGNQGQTAKTEGFIGIIGVSDILLDKEGTTLLLTVTGQTEILVNEQPATFADLLPGDKVKAKYDSGTNEAIQIMVEQ